MLVSPQLNELILRAVGFRSKEGRNRKSPERKRVFAADLFAESRRAAARFDVAIDNVNVCADGVTGSGV